MIYIRNIVWFIVLLKTISSENFIFISNEETRSFQFTPRAPNDISSVTVTYHGSESWSKINDMYEFFPPVVKPVCTCSCVNSEKNDCKFSATKNSDCSPLRNETDSCSTYITTVEHRAVCPDLVRICCQVYFFATNDTEKFHAITLIPKKTVYYFTILIENAEGFSKILKLAVPSDMKYIRLEQNIVMELQMGFIETPLPEKWYFTTGDGNILTSTDGLNEKYTYDLKKLAWFKRYNNGLVTSVSSYDLSNSLEITPLNCSTNKSKYEWNFEGRHYCRENKECTDTKGQSILQTMYDSVSHVTLNMTSGEVKIKQKYPNKAKISVKQYNIRNDNIILYEASLFSISKNRHNLTLKFLYSVKRKVSVVIGIPNWTWAQTIDIIISKTFPFVYSLLLEKHFTDPTWVCVIVDDGFKTHLCQFIQTITQTSMNLVFSNNNSDYFLTSQTVEMVDNQKEASTLSVAIAMSCLFIISIIIIIVLSWKLKQWNRINKQVLSEEEGLMDSFDLSTPFTNEDKSVIEELENKMKEMYKRKAIPAVLNINKTSSNLWKHYLEPNLTMDKETVVKKLKISEIFEECSPSKRIYIEGEPGFGKTSFAFKLAYEWAKGTFPNFKLAILIYLKDVVKNLNEFIAEQLKLDGRSIREIIGCLEHYQSGILMILDGYNDLQENRKPELLPILKGFVYPNMTIVITSRRGYFTEVSIHSKIKFFNDYVPADLWYRRLIIEGIDINARKDYLEDCLKRSSKSQKDISNYAFLLEYNLLKYPNILIMVGEIISQLPENISTITPVYHNLLQFLVHRSLENKNKACHAEKTIQDMGEYVLSKILKTDMNSNSISEIIENMNASGILRRNGSKECVPLHQSLFDYLAAYYLHHLKMSSNQLFQDYVERLMPVVLQIPPHSMIFLFLVGLLGRNATELLHILKKYSFKIRSYFQMLLGILTELETDKLDFTCLHPFIPKVWKIPWTNIKTNFTESILHSKMIEYGIQKKSIMIIDWKVKYKCSYPKNVIVDKIIVRLKDHVNDCYKEIAVKMHCKELLCLIYSCYEENLKKIWKDFFSLIAKISYEKISFQIWSALYISQMYMKSMVCEESFSSKLLCFQCQIHSEEGYFKNSSEDNESQIHLHGYYNNNNITKIIKSNKLKIIHLAFHGDVNANSFQAYINTILESVAVSSNIEKLILINSTNCNCEIHLRMLSNNGERYFSYVWFVGFTLKCDDEHDVWSLSIKNFTHWSYVKESGVQFQKRIIGTEVAAIEGELLCKEAENNDRFQKFLKNLKELDITLGKSVYEEEILQHVSKCSNLQILYLTATGLGSKYFTKAIAQFLDTLSVLKSVHTVIIWHGEENVPFYVSLFKELKRRWVLKQIRNLKKLKFSFSILNQNDDSFIHFKNILEIFGELVINEWIQHSISIVTQIGPDMLQETNRFFNIIDEIFLPQDVLLIESDFDGSSDEDCGYSQRYFLAGKLEESFIIKRRQYTQL